MRRHSTGQTGSRTGDSGGEQGFWPSYADMMSSFALILFFLMLLSYIQNLVTGNDLQNTQEALADTKIQLSLTEEEAADAAARLALLTSDLEEVQLTLSEKQKEIEGYALEIGEQESTIAAQSEKIDEQEKYLAAANDELSLMRDKMQAIAVLRLSILEQIEKSIASVMGDASKVSIGDNGNIILSESVLFDLGSSEVKKASETVLDEMIDVFDAFLSDPENAKYVDSVIISGHADSTGVAEQNRVLSTERANSVLNYLLTGRGGKLEKYAKYFCAAGYGSERPVQSNDTEAGRAANRRIEISIILRDESVLKIVEQYLSVELPELQRTNPDRP